MTDRPHVCPWWIGYLLASPLRKLVQRPDRLLAPHVKPGMNVLDFGSAMGFFSLPLARMVGPDGRVLCVDCQPFMLDRLMRRARRARLQERIEARLATNGSYGLAEEQNRLDLALAMAVVHEVPDQGALFQALHASLRPGGTLLLGEPTGHVNGHDFDAELESARAAGLTVADRPTTYRRTFNAVLRKAA